MFTTDLHTTRPAQVNALSTHKRKNIFVKGKNINQICDKYFCKREKYQGKYLPILDGSCTVPRFMQM